ncbi:MAG: LysR family transcriptional regulator [Acidobacteria bacterium]|nr:LysR family transcriptional regulator [Acidobacteriota bacterium]
MRTDGKSVLKLRLLLGDLIAMGPGKADLLEAIRETGSISAAARRMGMDYRRAWALVEAMNQGFRKPLVEAAPGGARGGGAQVTRMGEEVLEAFRRLQAKAEAAGAEELAFLRRRAAKPEG